MASLSKILLVEDDPLILMVILQIVQRAVPSSVQILIAYDGEEGLIKAREARPDIIITDLMMPRMDGYDMVRSLRQEQARNSVRVIGVSCASTFDPRTKDFREVCDHFLIKPFSPNDLVMMLDRPE